MTRLRAVRTEGPSTTTTTAAVASGTRATTTAGAYLSPNTGSRDLVPRAREDSDLSVEEIRRDFPPPGYGGGRDIRRARSAEPGAYYDDYDDRHSHYSRDDRGYDRGYDRGSAKKGSSLYIEEEEKKQRHRVLSKQEKIIAALGRRRHRRRRQGALRPPRGRPGRPGRPAQPAGLGRPRRRRRLRRLPGRRLLQQARRQGREEVDLHAAQGP